jgi:hypothetical protein
MTFRFVVRFGKVFDSQSELRNGSDFACARAVRISRGQSSLSTHRASVFIPSSSQKRNGGRRPCCFPYRSAKLAFEQRNQIKLSQLNYPMNFNLATILASLAILFVLITYITTAPLVPVAVILLGLAIILGGRGTNLRP